MQDVSRSSGSSGTPWMYEHALYAASIGNNTEARRVLSQTIYNQGHSSGRGQVRPVQMLVDLAVMELEGKGGRPDVPNGMAHLKQAAALGNKNAQHMLGVIQERGQYGVTKDSAQAH